MSSRAERENSPREATDSELAEFSEVGTIIFISFSLY